MNNPTEAFEKWWSENGGQIDPSVNKALARLVFNAGHEAASRPNPTPADTGESKQVPAQDDAQVDAGEYMLGNAVRDICSVSVAPASKSEVRRILERLLHEQEEKVIAALDKKIHQPPIGIASYVRGWQNGITDAIQAIRSLSGWEPGGTNDQAARSL